MKTPLLKLNHISRVFRNGSESLRALDDINLEIHRGEFVAIIGQSGSGKSTLMNILGCLDRQDEGDYMINGDNVATLPADELAVLRRDTFGFVFQRYNLMSNINALENVELPAIYAGVPKTERRDRASFLLNQLGLGDRQEHKPNQLSGGQQQRVSIARALVNQPSIILADEPTGALDSQSGEDVMAILEDLHKQGHTIILITHEKDIAERAERIVQIKDGRVIEDSGLVTSSFNDNKETVARGQQDLVSEFSESVKMAWRALRANLFRSILTLLGVVIGVAAVVTMMAIGNGSRQEVIDQIASMGTNIISVMPGAPGNRPSGDIATLVRDDAALLSTLDGVTAVSPERSTRTTVRYGATDFRTSIEGIQPENATTQNRSVSSGRYISESDIISYAPVIVLGKTVADTLFSDKDPLGEYVLVGNIPFEVIGVLNEKGANTFGSDQDSVGLVPLTTGFARLFGRQYLSTIQLQFSNEVDPDVLMEQIRQTLVQQHGLEDFQVRSTSSLMEMATATQNTLTLLLGSVAAISLLVGGIGVMNIMLVNVTERTREIGVRMATGAKRRNILLQFNTEALVICGIGGITGVLIGLLAGLGLQYITATEVVFTAEPALLAFFSSVLTGLLFGYLPARKAANLNPVAALASQ